MATFVPTEFFKAITGRLSGNSQIMTRQKHFRLLGGKLTIKGAREAYCKQRRDYKRHPLTESERRQLEKWTAVCREASAITHDANHPRHAEFQDRWQRLLNGHEDPVVGKKLYAQFGNFVRAVLLRE